MSLEFFFVTFVMFVDAADESVRRAKDCRVKPGNDAVIKAPL
jgi:hypothetical protein